MGKLLHIILADTELETVPKKISSDKTIKRRAQKSGRKSTEIILDSNYHHKAMKKINDSGRRGRPDIAHVCLLTALDSPLNKKRQLNFNIHTRHNKIIRINPETRIPRSYNRFIGLIEQLFQTKKVPPENPLIRMESKSLEEIIDEINPDKTINFSENGTKLDRNEFLKGYNLEEDILVIIGGFPHGDFLSNVEKFSDETISLYSETLDAVTVVNHVIQFYEEEYDII